MGILGQQQRGLAALVVLLALAVAAISARPHAGSWNDGSRMATVECLVDYHTFAIDESIYGPHPAGLPYAYVDDPPELREQGTLDKMYIQGHFYSHQPPFPAVLMAGVYKTLQGLTGLHARTRPDLFYYWMTLLSCGLAYVIATWCIFRLGVVLGLSTPLGLGLTASFALATIALPYTENATSHLLQLAPAAAVLLGLVTWAVDGGRWRPGLLLGIGFLAGLAYSIEQAAGGLLAAWVVLLVAYRSWRPERRLASLAPAALVGLGALPCALAHHILTYVIGGSLRPAGMFPEYFDYPGSAFTPRELTGAYNHPSILHFLAYAGGLLLGDRGFLQNNLPLFLIPPGLLLLRRACRPASLPETVVSSEVGPPRTRDLLPEIVFACGWSVCTWLVYALLSTNFSGHCCSIRWFVPLLAAGYFLLALLVRDSRALRFDFLVLSVWGAVLAGLMWYAGPWESEAPLFWPVQGAALATWLATSRLLPAGLDRATPRLMLLGWPLLIAAAVALVLLERGSLDFLMADTHVLHRGGEACLCLLLGLIIGVGARAAQPARSCRAAHAASLRAE